MPPRSPHDGHSIGMEAGGIVQVGSREHYAIMEQFEREFYHARLDRETKELWAQGNVYQHGGTNDLFSAYLRGYAFGKAVGAA